ncbi:MULTISPECIES: hypothetical protein [unclassified Pseudomonas]|uniref:hypothetical protein n=1 Tax=unclassified Pseudomonas TaxID=196821 RepID=UPI0024480662|nr:MULTISPECIES: hypothetical protein [unclassified Pseudomonas]MDG9928774.1 hypothetical protein [Pseudomonas sp. GD04042]MDH0481843.1 hypothetical protein [Pseudomonas sp. GD04015]MDH0603215.1 hypothetical protein [Pseudomonas sp. GD03869]
MKPSTVAHLLAFAEAKGRFWRTKMRDFWRGDHRVAENVDQGAALQSLRNTCAPLINRVSLEHLRAWREEDQFRVAATEQWHREGEVEIDENAVVSIGEDDGAYVQAWVWVDRIDLSPAVETPAASGL